MEAEILEEISKINDPLHVYVADITDVTVNSTDAIVDTTNGKSCLGKRKITNIILSSKKKRNRKKYLGMRAHELFDILKEDAILFCQQNGLIASSAFCSCGNQMNVYKSGKIMNWNCRRNNHHEKFSMRKGTWFQNSRLSVADILWIAYMWVHEYSHTVMLHESGLSFESLQQWCNSCSDACKAILEIKTYPIGGEGKVVEIFECKCETKPKNKKVDAPWILCALEWSSSNVYLSNPILKNNSENLCEALTNCALPHTTVVINTWDLFAEIGPEHFDFLTKKKMITFYDSLTEKVVETIEDFWVLTGRPRIGLNKHTKLVYNPEFFERFYRRALSNAPDAYLSFLRDIAIVFKPQDQHVKNAGSLEAETELVEKQS